MSVRSTHHSDLLPDCAGSSALIATFVSDGLKPVQEKNGGTVTANLLTGLGIDEFLIRTDGVGSRALLTDALGSTVALGDGTGTLQTQYTYEPFGYVSQTGQANSSSYKYTGREDDGTGLSYYRARYYHPRLQRFIEEDPIEFAGGVSMYAYVSNSPIVFVDPSGLAACVYSITQHTLVCTSNDGSLTSTLGPGGVFSGIPGSCRNNPSCSDDNDRGPIPPGNYRMNKDDRPGHSNYWRLEPNPTVSGWKCMLGLARCGFMLHSGGVSRGCITTSKNDPTAMSQYMGINNMLNRDLGINTLSVVP